MLALLLLLLFFTLYFFTLYRAHLSLFLLLLLLRGLNTRYVIHTVSEESQVWKSHVSLQEGTTI